MKIIFFGTPKESAECLEAINRNFDVIFVYTKILSSVSLNSKASVDQFEFILFIFTFVNISVVFEASRLI